MTDIEELKEKLASEDYEERILLMMRILMLDFRQQSLYHRLEHLLLNL